MSSYCGNNKPAKLCEAVDDRIPPSTPSATRQARARNGAEGGSRTRTTLRSTDFKSAGTGILPDLTKRDEPIFTGLAVVKVSLRLVSYQHVPPPS